MTEPKMKYRAHRRWALQESNLRPSASENEDRVNFHKQFQIVINKRELEPISEVLPSSIKIVTAIAQSILTLAAAEATVPVVLLEQLSQHILRNDFVVLAQKVQEGGELQLSYALRLAQLLLEGST